MNQDYRKFNYSYHQEMVGDLRKKFFLSLFATLPVLALYPLIQELVGFQFTIQYDQYLLFFLSAVIFFYGGSVFINGATEEFRKEQFGMMTLVALAISIAFFYNQAVVFGLKGRTFFLELVLLIDIMLLAHWIEMTSVLGASRTLETVASFLPSHAHAFTAENGAIDVHISKLQPGNFVLIKPGEKVPVDGVIVKGQTNMDESMITGESKSVEKKEGDKVMAGSINKEGSLEVKVTGVGEKSYIAQVISLVRKGEEEKSKIQDIANRAALWLTVITIYIAIVTLFAWFSLTKDSAFSLERMVTVIVISCPHALSLAVPLAIAASTSLSAKKGILIRNRVAFEKARNLDTIVFNKTGILTKGEFEITDVVAEFGYKEKDIIFYAASLESSLDHPIAKALNDKAKKEGIKTEKVEDFVFMPAKGVKGVIDKKEVKVVGQNYLKEIGIEVESSELQEFLSQGKTVVYILVGKRLIGAVALADAIKEESKKAVASLKKRGIKCIMVTGDDRKTAERVARELKLDSFFAEVLPDQKVKVVKRLQEEEGIVAMVGDGVNDALALIEADVGIAVSSGANLAIESADVVLVGSDPRDMVYLVDLAKVTYSKMRQNLLWAFAYNIIAIPLASGLFSDFGILLSPALGASLMSLSTIITAINASFLSVRSPK